MRAGGHSPWCAVSVLLLAFAVGGLALCFKLVSAHRQAAAVAAIRAIGGTVRYEYEVSPEGYWLEAEPPSYRGLTALLGVDLFCAVRSVDFPKGVSDHEVRHILHIPSVRAINLAYCYDISDEGVAYLARLPNLRVLDLYRNDLMERNNHIPDDFDLETQGRITDASLAHLSTSKTLEELHLMDNEFTDVGLTHLARVKSLREVTARSPRFTESGVVSLKKALPNAKVSVDITPSAVVTPVSP